MIIVGGVLAETRSQVVAERQRIDQLTEMMVATSLMMQASQEERNADLASRVSTIATAIPLAFVMPKLVSMSSCYD